MGTWKTRLAKTLEPVPDGTLVRLADVVWKVKAPGPDNHRSVRAALRPAGWHVASSRPALGHVPFEAIVHGPARVGPGRELYKWDFDNAMEAPIPYEPYSGPGTCRNYRGKVGRRGTSGRETVASRARRVCSVGGRWTCEAIARTVAREIHFGWKKVLPAIQAEVRVRTRWEQVSDGVFRYIGPATESPRSRPAPRPRPVPPPPERRPGRILDLLPALEVVGKVLAGLGEDVTDVRVTGDQVVFTGSTYEVTVRRKGNDA